MSRASSTLILAAVLAAGSGLAQAQSAPAPAEQELVQNADMTLTRVDWDAELLRIPAEQRAAFVTSPQRVQSALNGLIVAKTLAARARRAELHNDPLLQRRIAIETDRVLAAAMIERIAAEAGAEFDRNGAQNLARARELYTVDAKRFAVPEQVDASHILFDTQKRTPEQALAAAREARAKLVAGADFAALARELSDDPSAKRNGGRLGSFSRGRMDPAFEEAAFAQSKVGELSDPVLSKFGYHLIRREGYTAGRQRSFDEVEGQIIAEMRIAHVNRAREDAVNAIRGDPAMVINRPAVESLVVPLPAPPESDAASAAKPAS